MKITDILKLIEEHMEQVSVTGERNWQILIDCKKSLRELRSALEKAEVDQKKKEEADHGTGKDAVQPGEPESGAGTV